MLAPLLSKWLYEYTSDNKEFYNEISINRYKELYKN